MRKTASILFTLTLLLIMAFPLPAQAAAEPSGIPTFSIVSVVAGETVTIRTNNFPANDSFDVLMGRMGTRGVGGTRVATINSGRGGSFTATFDIPAGLADNRRIAIRLQSNTGSGYFAYNWFYNNTSGSGTGGGDTPITQPGSGIPTFTIQSVARDDSVTILTRNFPANDTFEVLMGKMGTRGVNGIRVDTINSGSGGSFTATFDIPAELHGLRQIAIRLQSTTGSGYFSFNWFYNNTTGTGTGGGDDPVTRPGYSGFPTFSISAVVRDQTVTIQTRNLPPNDQFRVLMGPMGTRGVNGYSAGTFDSGEGGSQSLTFNIPAELAGSRRIAIRFQSPSSGYFAYNWFYNNTYP